jgi:hypothetical protein
MRTQPTSQAIAFGLPLPLAIARMEASAKELTAAAEKAPGNADSFGQRITKAVKARVQPHHSAAATPQAEDETFARKIARAVKAKPRRCRLTGYA